VAWLIRFGSECAIVWPPRWPWNGQECTKTGGTGRIGVAVLWASAGPRDDHADFLMFQGAHGLWEHVRQTQVRFGYDPAISLSRRPTSQTAPIREFLKPRPRQGDALIWRAIPSGNLSRRTPHLFPPRLLNRLQESDGH